MNTRTREQRRGPSARPAEVLAASAYRPLPPASYSAPVGVAHAPAYNHYSQQAVVYSPSPVPAVAQGGYMTQEQYIQAYNSGYRYTSQPQPYTVHPTPELAMARAASPQPVQPARVATPRQPPIPELGPARYQGAPGPRAVQRPVAEVMISRNGNRYDQREVQRALTPLAQPAQQQWVASPATAMRP